MKSRDRFQPRLEAMLEKVDNKYTLTMLLAKRARELNEEESLVERENGEMPLTVAMREVARGELNFERIRQFEEKMDA